MVARIEEGVQMRPELVSFHSDEVGAWRSARRWSMRGHRAAGHALSFSAEGDWVPSLPPKLVLQAVSQRYPDRMFRPQLVTTPRPGVGRHRWGLGEPSRDGGTVWLGPWVGPAVDPGRACRWTPYGWGPWKPTAAELEENALRARQVAAKLVADANAAWGQG